MYALVFMFIMLMVMGVYTQMFTIQSGRMWRDQTAAAESMVQWTNSVAGFIQDSKIYFLPLTPACLVSDMRDSGPLPSTQNYAFGKIFTIPTGAPNFTPVSLCPYVVGTAKSNNSKICDDTTPIAALSIDPLQTAVDAAKGLGGNVAAAAGHASQVIVDVKSAGGGDYNDAASQAPQIVGQIMTAVFAGGADNNANYAGQVANSASHCVATNVAAVDHGNCNSMNTSLTAMSLTSQWYPVAKKMRDWAQSVKGISVSPNPSEITKLNEVYPIVSEYLQLAIPKLQSTATAQQINAWNTLLAVIGYLIYTPPGPNFAPPPAPKHPNSFLPNGYDCGGHRWYSILYTDTANNKKMLLTFAPPPLNAASQIQPNGNVPMAINQIITKPDLGITLSDLYRQLQALQNKGGVSPDSYGYVVRGTPGSTFTHNTTGSYYIQLQSGKMSPALPAGVEIPVGSVAINVLIQ